MAMLAGGAVAAIAAGAINTAAPRPSISSVSFSGLAGSNHASPTLTVTGVRFGANPPAGVPDSVTSCGTYAANGNVYGNRLYFEDDRNFEAGNGSSASTGDCVGIIVVSWTSTKVVLKFGNSYGGFDHWFLSNGDGYAISIKTGIFGGTVTGLT
jgi:hypothetical protein